MYISIKTFKSSTGKIFFQGEKISNFTYFFLSKKDKVEFTKNNISIEYNPLIEKRTLRTMPKTPSHIPNHYGYGPEPGYTCCPV